jgi:hypothetical protein
MTRKKQETREETYGRNEVLTDEKAPARERDLWAAVIWQAILDVNYRVHNWKSSLRFLMGGGQWVTICEILDLEPVSTSKRAVKVATGPKLSFAKRIGAMR